MSIYLTQIWQDVLKVLGFGHTAMYNIRPIESITVDIKESSTDDIKLATTESGFQSMFSLPALALFL